MRMKRFTKTRFSKSPVACIGILGILVIFVAQCSSKKDSTDKEKMQIVFQTDFEDDNLNDWQPTDANAWRIERVDDNRVLSLFSESDYNPRVSSPKSIHWIKDLVVGDFSMDLKMRSTTEDYDHRDLCLCFGYQDSSHFYYIHLANQADSHAHSIFLVNGESRVSIAKTRTDGIVWGEDWHDVRVVRNLSKGGIEVFFDDFTKPIMTAADTHFGYGKVGVGSYDDTGYFDDIIIRGNEKKGLKD